MNIYVEALDSQALDTKQFIKKEVMYVTRTEGIFGDLKLSKTFWSKTQPSNVCLSQVTENHNGGTML